MRFNQLLDQIESFYNGKFFRSADVFMNHLTRLENSLKKDNPRIQVGIRRVSENEYDMLIVETEYIMFHFILKPVKIDMQENAYRLVVERKNVGVEVGA